MSKQQLYSTRSYQEKDLRGISLVQHDTTNWSGFDLSDQDLTGSNLDRAYVLGAEFSRADLRGADADEVNFDVAVMDNAIRPDGTVLGLKLSAGDRLVVRNHPLPVLVQEQFSMDRSASLEVVLGGVGQTWTSTIHVAQPVHLELAGTLEFSLARNADPYTLVGQSIQVFEWAAQLGPGTAFDQVLTPPGGLVFDLTQLYAMGIVTVDSLPGDADLDGKVDLTDFASLKNAFGSPGGLAQGDFNGNGNVDLADFGILKSNFGRRAGPVAVPEPASALLSLLAIVTLLVQRVSRRRNVSSSSPAPTAPANRPAHRRSSRAPWPSTSSSTPM